MRRADQASPPDPLPRLPRDVLALMASVGLRLQQVAVVPAPKRRAERARKPRAAARRIVVAEGWAPRAAGTS